MWIIKEIANRDWIYLNKSWLAELFPWSKTHMIASWRSYRNLLGVFDVLRKERIHWSYEESDGNTTLHRKRVRNLLFNLYEECLMIIKSTPTRRINKIEGLNVMGKPDACAVAFDSREFNIYRVSDAMGKRGWNLNALQFPFGIHICITYLHTHDGVAQRFIADLKEIVADIRKNPCDDAQGAVGCALVFIFQNIEILLSLPYLPHQKFTLLLLRPISLVFMRSILNPIRVLLSV